MPFRSSARWMTIVAMAASLMGCDSTEVKLADAPPTKIEPAKNEPATKTESALKSGAPPTGSSAGIQFNPSEMPPPK